MDLQNYSFPRTTFVYNIFPGERSPTVFLNFLSNQSFDFCKRLFFTFHFKELEVIFFMIMHFIIEYIKPC